MKPTIQVKDRIIVSKASYCLNIPLYKQCLLSWSSPSVGDVVTLNSPDSDVTLLKRVIGKPGDTVAVRQGRVWRNGDWTSSGDTETLKSGSSIHHINRGFPHGGGPDWGPITIPEDRYLVMGDNRGNSHDGRSFGLVRKSDIWGQALGVFWRQGRPTWDSL